MKARLMAIIIIVTIMMALTPVASAAPGDVLATITTPKLSPSGIAIGIAVDCEDPATLYYTHSYQSVLYMMDKNANDLGSVPLTDDNGKPISFGAISWDETRQKLWAGTDNAGSPVQIYLVNPATGVSKYIFTLNNLGIGFDDGIAFDGSDNSLWITDDVSTWVEHWDVSGIDASGAGVAVYITTIYPKEADGSTMTNISGVAVGKGDILYLGRDGLGKISRVHKDGTYHSEFTTVGGRDEDLECDMVSFAPLEVLWSKDAYNNQVFAIEVETGTCVCPGEEEPCCESVLEVLEVIESKLDALPVEDLMDLIKKLTLAVEALESKSDAMEAKLDKVESKLDSGEVVTQKDLAPGQGGVWFMGAKKQSKPDNP